MHIHVLSPYHRQFAYPSFWKLVDQMSAFHDVYNPIETVRANWLRKCYATKMKHLLPLLFSILSALMRRKAPDVIVTFGTYQMLFIFLLRRIFPRARLITYQPELFEFGSHLMTKAFRASAHHYDLFIDVEPMRLKLRRRYFKRMRQAYSVVLPNFDHKVEPEMSAPKKCERAVYAGVLDKESSLIRMCAHFNIDTADLDCFVTKFLEKRPLQLLNVQKPRPFHLIASQGYEYGLICYPFEDRVRRSLNNKYCAPSKLFSYLAWGIRPVHYGHPTLKEFVKAGFSTDCPLKPDFPEAGVCADVGELFAKMEAQTAAATDAIIAALSRPAKDALASAKT